MSAPLPYQFLPPVPAFTLKSADLADGEPLPEQHTLDHGNRSPQLAWSDFPATTQGFAVSCYDPDAPTGCGFWHWLMVNVPRPVTAIERGAEPPTGALVIRNDFGEARYCGAAPPPGPAHRYVFAVHAVDVPDLGVSADATAAMTGFHLTAHTVGRAVLINPYPA
ncbi:YbhB/YbcL family Raf kinase inhibitor-like protein [Pilimelia columellifera]|uniref:YbhB/YbcL family Raf kinase inhibitor-like protein n=1 Tax=Pilimelia columellifera subsp. columellifera TaxID=706583 RepID=A0ABP6B2E3_9ACTN